MDPNESIKNKSRLADDPALRLGDAIEVLKNDRKQKNEMYPTCQRWIHQ